MVSQTLLTRLANVSSAQDWESIRILLADAEEEITRMRIAVDRVFSAIENEGSNPEYHRRIMREHRRQWPMLWKALDLLDEEARRG